MSCPTANYYTPSTVLISAVSNAEFAVVTTASPHGYVTNEVVGFFIPAIFGMSQLSRQSSPIVVTSDTTFITEINTLGYTPFAIPDPLPSAYTCAQVVSIGQKTTGATSSTLNSNGAGILCPVQNTGEGP